MMISNGAVANRWLVWTIVLVVATALVLLGYIEYQKGELDRQTADILYR